MKSVKTAWSIDGEWLSARAGSGKGVDQIFGNYHVTELQRLEKGQTESSDINNAVSGSLVQSL